MWSWKSKIGRVVGLQIFVTEVFFISYKLCHSCPNVTLHRSVRHRSNFSLVIKYILCGVLRVI